MKKVTVYEIVDHGFESAQYFQGCGTALTEFEDVATGIGDTAREAFEDARESLAQNDWDTSGIKGKSRLSRQTVRGYLRSLGVLSKEDFEVTETSYHLSIRVRGES